MRFISSLCWIKQGICKTPSRLKLEKNEMKQIFNDLNRKRPVPNEESNDEANEKEEEEEDTDKKYNLDEYDDEDENLKLEYLNSLACFSNNTEDNLLTIKDDGEDSDMEDFEIKKTDNVLICGHFDEDVCSLNLYLYNDKESTFYIHHDIMLPSYPICLEWLDFDPTVEESTVNYVAVGSLNPWIEIWDLDIVDSLEPDFVLGSRKANKKKKTLKVKEKIMGHKKAVLDLAWNNLNRNILASCSADKSVILWDLEQLKQATKIRDNSEKVQSIKFHPIESFSLLSGSSDKTVTLYDCRNPKSNKKVWTLNGETEQVLWNQYEPNNFLCSDGDGNVHLFDIRQTEPLQSLKAHDSGVNCIALSSQVTNMFVSASEDENVKIWDIKQGSFELIHEKKLKILNVLKFTLDIFVAKNEYFELNKGPINSVKSNPDSGFIFAFGGAKSNNPVIWDSQEVQKIREVFYPRMGMKEEDLIAMREEEAKAEKNSKPSRKLQRAANYKKGIKSSKIKSKKLKSK